MTKWRDCDQGTACGDACISRAFTCYDYLSPEALDIAKRLVSIARRTTHADSLFEYTDEQGRSWFVKRYRRLESDTIEAEARAYVTAQRLGMAGMLVRPKFAELPDGKVLAIWPKLKGQTLRSYLADGGKLTPRMRLALAVARQFDEAISNPDRNTGNVWVTESGQIRLIDNDMAFSSNKLMSKASPHASGLTLEEARRVWQLT